MKGQPPIEESNGTTGGLQNGATRRLMLSAGACALQSFLAAAFNAGKDIQQAQNVRVKGPYPSSSGLWIRSRFKHPHRHSPLNWRAFGRRFAGLLLVDRAPSVLSPSLVKYSCAQLLSIDAGSVTWRIGQKPVCPWESGGLHLGKR
jgi:hypothetical protein